MTGTYPLVDNKRLPPLAGVRVLDIATRVAGPFCATLLAEFGADVIKVELPGEGDPLRHIGTMTETGSTLNWLSENRNKKAITLDLRKREGADIFKRLLVNCDILVENFRPGTLESWGLAPETLKGINKDLIVVRISAYGQDGPYRNRPGVARVAFGYSGIAHVTGEPDGPPLMPGSAALGDYIGGLYGAVGALTAYIARQRDGIGQGVDVSLYEGMFRMLDEMAPAYARTGFVRQRMGADDPNAVPNNHYKTADGKWMVVACTADKLFQRLAVLMERPDLADHYPTLARRKAGREAVNQAIAAWVGSLSQAEVMQRCLAGDVPAGPINTIADIFEDEHFRTRRTLVEIEDARAGKVVIPNVMPRLSDTPGEIRSLGPDLGQDNFEIYRDRLGFSDAEIQRLKSANII